MNASEFLARFADVPDDLLHKLRRSGRLDEWPPEPQLYLNVAERLIPGPTEEWEMRQRLVSILREFLYHDGRSFDALMYIAAQAVQTPGEYDSNGVNVLAGIYCYLNRGGCVPWSDEQLTLTLQRYAHSTPLAHNARACLRIMVRRRPDLCSQVIGELLSKDFDEAID